MRMLLPHLLEKGLVSPYEHDTLDRMVPYDQNMYLLRILPGKGKDSFKRFLECLKDEKEHLGHKDLATCLSLSYQVPVAV